MTAVDETVFKLKEFSLWSDATTDSRYDAKPCTLEDLIKEVKINIVNIDTTNFEMEFDMKAIGTPIANAIRRILIAEVPTMAIDKVNIYNNTTVIPDEVLAHRLGLIPIKADPRLFEYKTTGDEDGTEEDTIQFELKVKCSRKPTTPKNVLLPDEKAFNHAKVKSEDMKFVPIGNQKEMYGDIRPVNEDILLAVMKPGHEIDLKAFCYKNIGRVHAKFSPVVIASYKLLPQLRLLNEISGERAHTLAKCFPKGVIKVSKKKDKEVAKVVDSRKIECSRNVFLHDDIKNDVEVCKVKDHYIFTVESSGALPPEVLVLEAMNVLKEKCRTFLLELRAMK